jgi:hypothetical protein
MEEGGLGVDVNGRANLGGDARGGDVFAVEFVVLVVEEVHVRWRVLTGMQSYAKPRSEMRDAK